MQPRSGHPSTDRGDLDDVTGALGLLTGYSYCQVGGQYGALHFFE